MADPAAWELFSADPLPQPGSWSQPGRAHSPVCLLIKFSEIIIMS